MAGDIDQFTAVFVVPVTVATNVCCCDCCRLAEDGLTDIAIAAAVGAPAPRGNANAPIG